MERFIKEYANYQKRIISNNELMRPEIKNMAIKKINGALRARERGLIIPDDAVKLIMDCCSR